MNALGVLPDNTASDSAEALTSLWSRSRKAGRAINTITPRRLIPGGRGQIYEGTPLHETLEKTPSVMLEDIKV